MRNAFLVVSLLLAGVSAAAESPAGAARRELRAARTPAPPVLDGRLDDEVWGLAEVQGDFVQRYPQPDAPPAFATEVRVLFDEEALYVGARCHDPDPNAVVAPVTRRDVWLEADTLLVEIDSRRDGNTGFFFQVNAAGVQLDGTMFDENMSDTVWDGVWQAEVAVTAGGWEVELRLPLKLLRFQAAEQVAFGINFSRHISRLKEDSQWQYIPPDSGLHVSRFGLLTGLDLPARPLSLDIAPYLASRLDWGSEADGAARPFDGGLDLRLGLGGNFMLSLTANPDFGQVEADPAVLNLSTFENYYPEKRPFFLEDMGLFQRPQGGGWNTPAELFYTRRIGRSPRAPALGDDESQVRSARLPMIYGAAKLAGQLPFGLSLGALQAVTSAESAEVEAADGRRVSRLAEPLASFTVVRVKQDFLEHSTAGLMATALATDGEGAAVTGGSDLRLELFDSAYHLLLLSEFSYLTEERYRWHDDFTRAALERDGPFGWGLDAVLSKDAGEHLVGSATVRYRSPTLALNDMGYQSRNDALQGVFWIQHRRQKPLGILNRYYLGFTAVINRNGALLNLGDYFILSGNVVFDNNWSWGAWFDVDRPRCDDRETRTAGAVGVCYIPPWIGGGTWVGSDTSKLVWFNIDLTANSTEYGWTVRPWFILGFNPMSRLQLQLSPSYQYAIGALRWIDTWSTGAGDRFLFAERHSELWDATLRASLTLTRDLTLQLYTQVFLAAVDHGRKLSAPVPAGSLIRQAELVEAPDVPDDYDLSFSSWLLSGVVRWEYRPGSVIYLVYQGSLLGDLERPEFRFQRQLGDLHQAPARHVLMLKISYLWG